MANFDGIAEFGLDQILAKRLATPGGAVAPTCAPELFPNITLENDRPEWGFLKGERMYSATCSLVAPGAGAHATLVLSNGSQTSDMIVVVQSILCVDQLCRISLGDVSGTTSSTQAGRPRDSRFMQQGSQALGITGNILTASLPVRNAFAPAGLQIEVPFVVTRGHFLMIATVSSNVTLNAHIQWTERRANPGEFL